MDDKDTNVPNKNDFISREAALACFSDWIDRYGHEHTADEMVEYQRIEDLPAADVVEIPVTGIGDLSDGYHTFNGLYYQRMILFAALVRQNRDRAWKSYRHEDGELCFGGGWFIVGIDTPDGSYTYHYESKDFNLFDCEELPVGKHWDGHTEADVTRLLSLPAADVRPVVKGKWVRGNESRTSPIKDSYICSVCGEKTLSGFCGNPAKTDFCPNCGADMRESNLDTTKGDNHD